MFLHAVRRAGDAGNIAGLFFWWVVDYFIGITGLGLGLG
jgi:hypothetical protein